MEMNQTMFHLFLFFLLAGFASSSTHVSYGAFESHGVTQRNLLQAKKNCPVDFEHQNYTIITSKCKGPQYQPKLCCDSLKEFACPYADEINDMSNNCASTMFSYINLYGKYPPGLFASMCKEGKDGLECQEQDQKDGNGSEAAPVKSSLLLMLASGLIVMLFLQY